MAKCCCCGEGKEGHSALCAVVVACLQEYVDRLEVKDWKEVWEAVLKSERRGTFCFQVIFNRFRFGLWLTCSQFSQVKWVSLSRVLVQLYLEIKVSVLMWNSQEAAYTSLASIQEFWSMKHNMHPLPVMPCSDFEFQDTSAAEPPPHPPNLEAFPDSCGFTPTLIPPKYI